MKCNCTRSFDLNVELVGDDDVGWWWDILVVELGGLHSERKV